MCMYEPTEFMGIQGRGYRDKWGNSTAEDFDFGCVRIKISDDEREMLLWCLSGFFVERVKDSSNEMFRSYELEDYIVLHRLERNKKNEIVNHPWTLHISRLSALKMWDELMSLIGKREV